jgi:hypothetical protein
VSHAQTNEGGSMNDMIIVFVMTVVSGAFAHVTHVDTASTSMTPMRAGNTWCYIDSSVDSPFGMHETMKHEMSIISRFAQNDTAYFVTKEHDSTMSLVAHSAYVAIDRTVYDTISYADDTMYSSNITSLFPWVVHDTSSDSVAWVAGSKGDTATLEVTYFKFPHSLEYFDLTTALAGVGLAYEYSTFTINESETGPVFTKRTLLTFNGTPVDFNPSTQARRIAAVVPHTRARGILTKTLCRSNMVVGSGRASYSLKGAVIRVPNSKRDRYQMR